MHVFETQVECPIMLTIFPIFRYWRQFKDKKELERSTNHCSSIERQKKKGQKEFSISSE